MQLTSFFCYFKIVHAIILIYHYRVFNAESYNFDAKKVVSKQTHINGSNHQNANTLWLQGSHSHKINKSSSKTYQKNGDFLKIIFNKIATKW